MSVTLLKDVLISCGELDRYFDGRTPVHLWRAHDTRKMAHPMDLVEEASRDPMGCSDPRTSKSRCYRVRNGSG
jgi:hypothetical protein